MSRRADPKSRNNLNEAAATGRRRAQVQEQSSRQRDATLRSRRLLVELAGAGGEVSEAALAALGPDVLADRVKVVAGTLSRWADLPLTDWQAALQQLATLLSTGSYQPVEAALSSGAVASLGSLLQLASQQLPRDAARQAAWALELLANSSPAAAGEVLAAAPVLASRLSAAVHAVGAARRGGAGGAADVSEGLLEADQLAAVLGAIAAWNPELQGRVIASGTAVPLGQLVLEVLEPAAEAASAAARALTQAPEQQQQQQSAAGELIAAEPPAVRCCTTALWAVGMMVRGRTEEILQLVSQPTLQAGLRRVLQTPPVCLGLLREAAWLLAFCTAGGGPEAVTVLVDLGGLLPGLLLATIRCVHQASLLTGEDQATQEAAQPLHQAIVPLLMALTNIAAEPSQVLLVLAELQASRPVPVSPLQGSNLTAAPPAAGTDEVMVPSNTTDLAPATPEPVDLGVAERYVSCMRALLGCLENRVSHRSVVRSSAALFAGLAWGACRAGSVATDSVRAVLQDSGVVAALVGLLRGGALDIRKEAAAALMSLCQGAVNSAGGPGGGSGEGGSGPGPGTLDMLRALGVHPGRDEHGVLAAFLGLLRSPDADAVHAGLRFVTLVLGGLRRGPQLVESMDGIDALEAVQYGTSGCRVPELQKWAEELVDLHYGEGYGEEEDEDDTGDDDSGM